MKQTCIRLLCTLCLVMAYAGAASASHPLITEDAGTMGKGKYQIEITGETGSDRKEQPNEDGSSSVNKAWESELKTTITYGITDTVDLSLEFPYAWRRLETDGATVASEKGISDISAALKWKFLEWEKFGFALKSEVWLPSGDHEKDLGAGRVSYGLLFLATKEIDPLAFHLNLGYRRNENRHDQREDIWHASFAAEWKALKKLVLVANIGIEKNPDRSSGVDPAFILGGLIYSINDYVDIDFGVKGGLTDTEMDLTWLGGITFKF